MNDMNNPGPDSPGSTLAILKRQGAHITERPSVFAQANRFRDADQLLVRAAAAGFRVVYLTGPVPGVDWWTAPVAHGWELRQWHNGVDRRTGVYHNATGATVDIRIGASWYDEAAAAGEQVATDCRAAHDLLRRQLRARFSDDTPLLATPAMTGRTLFQAVMPFGVEISPLPADGERGWLYDNCHQGRIELMPAPDGDDDHELLGLWQLDARWMYAACLSHLPTGPVAYDHVDEVASYVPGVYEATAFVPRDWAHIGLLPGVNSDGGATYYREPGAVFDTVATGAEIELAITQGWRVRIHSRLLWPGTSGRPDVARPWIERLKLARTALRTSRSQPVAGRIAAGAVRRIVLETIGSWFSHDTERHGLLPLERIAAMPAGAIPHLENGMVLYSWTEPTAPAMERHAHPEWSAIVWGRARARLARKALELPASDIVALRTDAIWTCRRPDVTADGADGDAPGSWRIKSAWMGQAEWPAGEADLLTLMRQSR